jgi:hypothetical protein
MWIYLNNSMISVVETPDHDDTGKRDTAGRKHLSVRARSVKDLKNFLGDDKGLHDLIKINQNRDYHCRIFLPRDWVADRMKDLLRALDYDNFKSSIPIRDTARQDWYHTTWNTAYEQLNAHVSKTLAKLDEQLELEFRE